MGHRAPSNCNRPGLSAKTNPSRCGLPLHSIERHFLLFTGCSCSPSVSLVPHRTRSVEPRDYARRGPNKTVRRGSPDPAETADRRSPSAASLRPLTDILHNGQAEALRDAWDNTEAAGELTPLPGGEYVARITAGELENSRTNSTPGYKLTFKVCEGEFTGRQFWHDVWLTPAALPLAKRDLAKIGVTSIDQLEQPLPRGIRCKCKLALRRDDDGNEYNRVRSFEVIGIDVAASPQ